MYYSRFDTDLCEIILAGDEKGLKQLHLNTGEGKRVFEIQPEWERREDFFRDIKGQILEYLHSGRTDFDIKVTPAGTDFQKKVWNQLRQIPYGETRTYGEIARAIGREKASRAVGAANSRNPLPLIIPCHRVIGEGGALTGFAHGIAIKKKLIEMEKTI